MKSKVLSTTFSLALGVACAATAAAAKYNVLPIGDSGTERLDPSTRPSLTHGRTEFTYFGAVTHAPTGNQSTMTTSGATVGTSVSWWSPSRGRASDSPT